MGLFNLQYITYLIPNWQFDYLNVLYQLDQVQGANSCHFDMAH